MLISDASLQKLKGFALGIAVNSSALLCKAGQQQLPVAEKGGWECSHSSESGSPGVTEDNRQCRPLAWAV